MEIGWDATNEKSYFYKNTIIKEKNHLIYWVEVKFVGLTYNFNN